MEKLPSIAHETRLVGMEPHLDLRQSLLGGGRVGWRRYKVRPPVFVTYSKLPSYQEL